MKKNREMHRGLFLAPRSKLFLVMKLTFLFLVIGLLEVQASLRAQIKTVDLDVKGMTLTDVFNELSRQTDLDFFFSNRELDMNRKISISVKNADLTEVLSRILGQGYSFEIVENMVIVKPAVVNDTTKTKSQPQVKLIQVTGRVVDEKGNPIPGATVLIQGTTQGVASDTDGNYVLAAKPDDVLRFSFIGYKPEVVEIKGKTKLNVRLKPTEENLEEVTVVAFGEQKKESVVSSITTVRPMDLKSSSSDLTASFAGKISGMIAWQTGGKPGGLTEEEMNTKFYIRGITSFQTGANVDPLILIDGVESSKVDLSRLAPEDIETFSVMKDASATAMYGARGANGVILVTTKKGEEGSVYTSFRYEAIASMPTREIEVVDPVTYMEMYNQHYWQGTRVRRPSIVWIKLSGRGPINILHGYIQLMIGMTSCLKIILLIIMLV
ncbi:MAG: carboxypeptidase-like regulatory domain-containing protein [Butyricimonas faecihominis]